jgi:hypothetical protein
LYALQRTCLTEDTCIRRSVPVDLVAAQEAESPPGGTEPRHHIAIVVVGVDYGRTILTALPQTVPISVYVVSAKVSLLGLAKRYGSTSRLATSMHSVERTPVQNHICINVKHEAHG